MSKISKLYHRIVSALILLKHKDIEIAKEKSFNYYRKNVLNKKQ